MGLDITIHRKDVKCGSDYWFNGRNAFREVKDFMVERYHYYCGNDFPLTFNLCEEFMKSDATDLVILDQTEFRRFLMKYLPMYVEEKNEYTFHEGE